MADKTVSMRFFVGFLVKDILSPINVHEGSGTHSPPSFCSVLNRAESNQPVSIRIREDLLRPRQWFKKHPAYIDLQLAVAPVQLAALTTLGELAFKDPLLVTRQGVIIDGYARKEYADRLGVTTLPCVEFDVGEEDVLLMILDKHRRSSGWNDYNRIRLAWRLGNVIRMQARANQRAGGQLKGLSKLTEANVRKVIAKAAGVSEGNVTKVDQLRNSDSEVLKALANGDIRIHRAWLWRGLGPAEQREQLRLYHLDRSLKLRVRATAIAHRCNDLAGVMSFAPSKVNAEHILRKLSTITSKCSEKITIGVLKIPGNVVLLSTELLELLGETESTL